MPKTSRQFSLAHLLQDKYYLMHKIGGLVQERHNSIATSFLH